MSNVFKIPVTLSDKYKGAGPALAAATDDGQLVDLIYIRDVIHDFSGEVSDIESAINDQRIGPSVRYLQLLGNVHVGMCSCWEFVEL